MLKQVKSVVKILMLSSLLIFGIEAYGASYEAYRFNRGNWMKYTLSALSDVVLPIVQETNKIEWEMFEVQQIVGTNISIRRTTKFKNNTETKSMHFIDVRSGDGTLPIPLITASNLEKGRMVFDSPLLGHAKINETRIERYLGRRREVNILFFYKELDPFGETWELYRFVWDKETGILCEMETLTRQFNEQNGKKIVDVLWTMKISDIDPDLWKSANETEIFIGIIIIVAGIFVILLLIRKMKT